MKSDETREGFARAVRTVATLNLGYFGIEFAVALAIGSVALFADSIDFLEDGAVNVLILIALARSPRTQARVGRLLAILLLAPTIATLWAAWSSYSTTSIPSPLALSITGLGALSVNLASAFLLVRFRRREGSLARGAFLSARNDALANVAIILAGGLTALTLSRWPDLVVGLGIAALNATAAYEVWEAAEKEELAARA